jgi:hypothetical protein
LGAKQQEAFDEIKKYLTSPPVLQAPKSGVPFQLYIAVEQSVIEAVRLKGLMARSMLLLMRVEDYWMPKREVVVVLGSSLFYLMELFLKPLVS